MSITNLYLGTFNFFQAKIFSVNLIKYSYKCCCRADNILCKDNIGSTNGLAVTIICGYSQQLQVRISYSRDEQRNQIEIKKMISKCNQRYCIRICYEHYSNIQSYKSLIINYNIGNCSKLTTVQDDPKRDDNIVTCTMSVLRMTHYQTILQLSNNNQSDQLLGHSIIIVDVPTFISQNTKQKTIGKFYFSVRALIIPRLKAVIGRPLKVVIWAKITTYDGVNAFCTSKRVKRQLLLLFRLTDEDGHCKSANGSGVSTTGRR